ncbi:MAG TPA: ComEC/Rec2 family competence protein [Gaiellaceae bacterium]|nr:ComEC/Rec2 family competence protein [Gaiellaceae bacterium]
MIGVVCRATPHLLVATLCVGLAAANAVRVAEASVGLAACALGLLAAFAFGWPRLALLAAALLLAGLWWGSSRLEALDRSVLAADVGEAGRLTLAVTGPARHSQFAVRVPAQVRRFRGRPMREDVLLRLPPARSPPQGAVLELTGQIRLPRKPDDGGFDERRWLRRQGVHVVVQAGGFRVIGQRGGLAGVADRLRARLARSMAPGLGGERRAVLAGVVLGEDEGLSDELRDRFRASGLYHLLAVSGQNVALVAGGALLVAWLLGVPRAVGQIGALAAIGAYVLAVGWQPSVVRAGVAGALACLAWLAARPRDRWYFFLLGAAVLLAWNPYSLLEPGFQLSFGAVAAIFVGVPPLEQLLEGYPGPRWLHSAVAVSTACGLATAPVLLLQFGSVPVYSVAANALAAPAMAPLLGLAFTAAFVEPVLPWLAETLGWLNGWLAAWLAFCARLVGGLPYARLSALTALLGAAVLVCAGLIFARLRPPRAPRAAALASLAVVVLVGWHFGRPSHVLPPPTGLRIVFLDVGQGDATLLQVPQGSVLVDEGPPEADVAGQLRRLGVKRLAALVLSHPSRDNIGGAELIVRRLDVGRVFDPALPFPNPFGTPALAAARARGIPITVTRAGQGFTLGRLRLRVLWPDEGASPGDDPNDHATVLMASFGSVDALLPADAESNVTGRLAIPPVEILKVGHHGSADAGLPDLLRTLRPRLAVISVGAHNDYGHPRASTLAALAAVPGLVVHRTDRDGQVIVESDGERISVRDER